MESTKTPGGATMSAPGGHVSHSRLDERMDVEEPKIFSEHELGPAAVLDPDETDMRIWRRFFLAEAANTTDPVARATHLQSAALVTVLDSVGSSVYRLG